MTYLFSLGESSLPITVDCFPSLVLKKGETYAYLLALWHSHILFYKHNNNAFYTRAYISHLLYSGCSPKEGVMHKFSLISGVQYSLLHF